ncbi:histidine kinase [Lapillicoccus sp.]|uniref:MadS family sensor histidine kinase n=1 Tax=Lapillicoccus sp. TaxID=1909287 RepID=UPI0025F7E54E|nr:histidine kinase [Lapillicoccus sp.]
MSEARLPDLAALTGVRSGKGSFYQEYVRSDERLQHAVRAMDSISRALVRTIEGPRGLLEEVARAAANYLDARWTVLGLADGHLPGSRPRFVAVGPDGEVEGDEERLPTDVRRELAAVRAGLARPAIGSGWVRVPMTLEGEVIGVLTGSHGLAGGPEPSDLSVLRILANQAAVSLHTSQQYQSGLAAQRRAQQLYDEATAQAQDLAVRTAELRRVEQRLQVAHQRELLDNERHRIARELHDSVTQFVLSAGMAVELARGRAEQLGPDASDITSELATAKSLSQQAVEQLRRAIYALYQPHGDTVSTLPELVQEVARHHQPHLDVQLRVEGDAIELPNEAHHEIARAIGEALFNVAAHAEATRVIIRLRYRPDEVRVAVADDGVGDPTDLSRLLRLERSTTTDGRHRGLVNIDTRIGDLGGSIAFRRARLGGVRVEMRIPLPLRSAGVHGLIDGLVNSSSSSPVVVPPPVNSPPVGPPPVGPPPVGPGALGPRRAPSASHLKEA